MIWVTNLGTTVYNKELKNIWSEERPWENRIALITFNCNKNTNSSDTKYQPECHSHMFIEKKALFAVLTGITHWNNYEIGSIFQVRRIPDIYKPKMQAYLNFLSVI